MYVYIYIDIYILYIITWVFSYQRCYLPEGGHICPRPKVEGKCALSRADNSADMKKPM